MKEIIKVMLQEGIDEETIHECLDVIEGWNGKPSFPTEGPGMGSKRVEMSPDSFIKKATNGLRREGINTTVNNEVHSRSTEHRANINKYKKMIQSPGANIDEPSLNYNQEEMPDGQDGFHRAIAAKELGLKKIPVHITYPTDKRTPQEKRQLKAQKIENRKIAKEQRKQEREGNL